MNKKSQITGKLKAIMFSVIGVAFIVGIVLGVFVFAPGWGSAKDKAALADTTASPGAHPSAEEAGQPVADIELEENFELPVLAEGESLYYGQAEYDETSKFLMAFVLSDDSSEIHDVSFYLKDLKINTPELQMSGVTVTETFNGTFPVGTGSADLDFGGSALTGLVINDDQASGELDYVYTNYSGADTIEVPLGKQDIVFANVTDKVKDQATGTVSAAPSEMPAPEATEAETPESAAAADITFEDKTYSVTIGEIGKNENGNTTVEIVSPGIGTVLPMRDGDWAIPVQATIVAGGEGYTWENVTTTADSFIFEYETTLEPEQIVLYPYGSETDESAYVVFDALTKTVMP